MEKLTKTQEDLFEFLVHDVRAARLGYDEWILKSNNYFPDPSKEEHRLHPTEQDKKVFEDAKNGIYLISGVNNGTLKALERKGYIKILTDDSLNEKDGIKRMFKCDKVQILEKR